MFYQGVGLVRRFMFPHFWLLLQAMSLYAAEFLFSFRTPWWWPPLFWEQIVLQVEYTSVLAVKKPFCVKNCPIGLVFQGEYLLSVSFPPTFPELWPNLLNLRIFPGLGILCLNSHTFPVFPDPWEPCTWLMWVVFTRLVHTATNERISQHLWQHILLLALLYYCQSICTMV